MRPAFQLSRIVCSRATGRVPEHILFRERPGLDLPAFRVFCQKPPAQQWELLQRDLISVDQTEIHADGEIRPLSIGSDALERIPPDALILAEAR